MKYLKTISLAALAAMALMAVVAASASASSLVCSTSGTGDLCSGGTHGKHYTGNVIAKNVGNVVLTVTNSSGSIINTVTCTASEAAGAITNSTAGTGNISKLTFSGCTSNVCGAVHATTTATVEKPWHATVATETKGVVNTNGAMTVSNVTGTFTCNVFGVPVTCAYKATSAAAKVTGSHTEPKLTATNVTLERESGPESTCGVKAHWNGTYKVTTPSSLVII